MSLFSILHDEALSTKVSHIKTKQSDGRKSIQMLPLIHTSKSKEGTRITGKSPLEPT